jgi:hypothetical protein
LRSPPSQRLIQRFPAHRVRHENNRYTT